jgi:hypothetical protein
LKKVGIIENVQPLRSKSTGEHYSSEEIMSSVGGNSGNLAFIHGAKKILANPLVKINWDTPPTFVEKEVDHIVICCANQLGSHVDLGGWADRIQNFSKPVTLLGLGVQSPNFNEFPELPEGTKFFLKVVVEHNVDKVSNIGVRGEYTKSFLETQKVASIAVGCPSLHISEISNLGRNLYDKHETDTIKKILVAAGNPFDILSSSIEPTLVDLVNKLDGAYVIQHPLTMLKFLNQERHLISEDTLKRFSKVYDTPDINEIFKWFKDKGVFFTNCLDWIDFIKKYNFALGPRYHGIALALQSGVPGVVIAIDARTRELCEGTGVPYVLYEEISSLNYNELLEKTAWTKEIATRFDKFRIAKSQMYFDFLNSQMLTPSNHLKILMNSHI